MKCIMGNEWGGEKGLQMDGRMDVWMEKGMMCRFRLISMNLLQQPLMCCMCWKYLEFKRKRFSFDEDDAH